MPAPAIKAASFNSLVGVLREMVPAPTFETFVDGLPAGCAALVREPPLAMSWIDLEQSMVICPAAYERLFDRNPAKMLDVGRMVSSTAFEAFVDGLPPATAALSRTPPLALSWISAEQASLLYSLVFQRLFDRDQAKSLSP